ncbi:hypothetical protein MMC25_003259 [Agyrium rufum]|nr:hypothetical protein [Agyrium rufum]
MAQLSSSITLLNNEHDASTSGALTKTIRDRLMIYRGGLRSSNCAEHALKNGYRLTNIGVLCEIPMPKPALLIRQHMFILCIEGAFTNTFWALHSRRVDHHAITTSRWDLTTHTFNGLCSYSAMAEAYFLEDYELTAAALEANVTDQKERENAASLRTYHKLASTKEGRDRINQNANAAYHRVRADPEKTEYMLKEQVRRENERASERKGHFKCTKWDFNCDRKANLKNLETTHLPPKFACETRGCGRKYNRKVHLKDHCTKHDHRFE